MRKKTTVAEALRRSRSFPEEPGSRKRADIYEESTKLIPFSDSPSRSPRNARTVRRKIDHEEGSGNVSQQVRGPGGS